MLQYLKELLFKEKTKVTANLSDQCVLERYYSMVNADKNMLAQDCNFVAVDFETTGLDYRNDDIISMGFCPLSQDCIRLSECLHIVLKTEQSLASENVAIHGLTDDALDDGVSQREALDIFMRFTEGKVIIAHYHGIEEKFIQKIALTVFGHKLPLRFVDTFAVAEKQAKRQNRPPQLNEFRLFNLRRVMNLPHYKAHNALEDAISTAELFLAQKAAINRDPSQIQLLELGFSKS